MGVQSIDAEDDQFAYRYDTQLLIERRDEDLDEDDIADYITEHFEGNSLIAAGDEDLVKIHFHTNEPWKILEYCNSVGFYAGWPKAWAVEVPGEEISNEWCEAVSDEEYGKLK